MNFKTLIGVDYIKRIITLCEIGNYSALILGDKKCGKTSVLKCITKLYEFNNKIKYFEKVWIRFYKSNDNVILIVDDIDKLSLEEIKLIFRLYKFSRFYFSAKILSDEIFFFIKNRIDFLIILEKPHSELFNKLYSGYTLSTEEIIKTINLSILKINNVRKEKENIEWGEKVGNLYRICKIRINPSENKLRFITELAEIISTINIHEKVELEDLSEAIQYYINLENYFNGGEK